MYAAFCGYCNASDGGRYLMGINADGAEFSTLYVSDSEKTFRLPTSSTVTRIYNSTLDIHNKSTISLFVKTITAPGNWYGYMKINSLILS